MLSIMFNPEDLLLSTIISIPKDNRGSMNSSDNYRGISLSNSICKLYDYVFIHLNMDYLKTDVMQFGFKNNHSTVLCTAVYIETMNHYMNEGSDVYSCLIDASKAFDIVHWEGGASSIRIEKKVSYILLRLIFDRYIRQKACVAWGIFRSQYFLFKYTTHTWLLGPLLDSVHMTYKLYVRDLKFIYCMKNNDNHLVRSCFEYVSNNLNSFFWEIK